MSIGLSRYDAMKQILRHLHGAIEATRQIEQFNPRLAVILLALLSKCAIQLGLEEIGK